MVSSRHTTWRHWALSRSRTFICSGETGRGWSRRRRCSVSGLRARPGDLRGWRGFQSCAADVAGVFWLIEFIIVSEHGGCLNSETGIGEQHGADFASYTEACACTTSGLPGCPARCDEHDGGAILRSLGVAVYTTSSARPPMPVSYREVVAPLVEQCRGTVAGSSQARLALRLGALPGTQQPDN